MSIYYSGRPTDVNYYREQTERGYSSEGLSMGRTCSKCKRKVQPTGCKKVPGSGGSRLNPARWICKECQ